MARWWMKPGLTRRSYYHDGCGTLSPAVRTGWKGNLWKGYLAADSRLARPTGSGGTGLTPLRRLKARCPKFYSRLKLKWAERLHGSRMGIGSERFTAFRKQVAMHMSVLSRIQEELVGDCLQFPVVSCSADLGVCLPAI
jgi:hypothetical protein